MGQQGRPPETDRTQHPIEVEIVEQLSLSGDGKTVELTGRLQPILPKARAIADTAELHGLVLRLVTLAFVLHEEQASPEPAEAIIAFVVRLMPGLTEVLTGPQGVKWTAAKTLLDKEKSAGKQHTAPGMRRKTQEVAGVGLRSGRRITAKLERPE